MNSALVAAAPTYPMTISRKFTGAESNQEQSYEFGFGGAATYRYDSGFNFASRRWSANGSVRGVFRLFDETAATQVRTREDFDLRLAIGNTAWIMDDLAIRVGAEYFLRESNIRNFDLDVITLTAGVQYAF